MSSAGTISTSLRNSTIAGAIGMFFFMIIQNGPIPLMLEKMGAGGVAIGLTTTLFQLGMMVQIPATFFTERLMKRKPFFIITNCVGRALIAVPGMFLLLAGDDVSAGIALTLVAIGMLSFLTQATAPVWFSWMAELVPENLRSAFWAKRQGWCMIASLITVALTGWFLDLFPEQSFAGFGWLLILAALFGIADIILHRFIDEPPPSPVNLTLSAAKRIFQPLENRDFRYFTLAMCIWFFGLGFFAPFMNVYLKNTFGVTYTHLSTIQISGMISSVVSSFVGGHLINRMGLRSFGLAMVLTVPLFSVAWFILDGDSTGLLPILGSVPQPIVVLCCSSIIAGGVFAGVGLMQLNLLPVLSLGEGRTMAMAVHWSLIGLLSALGPISGGWVKDHFTAHPIDFTLFTGIDFSYFHVIILIHNVMIWFIMFPLLMQIRKKDGEWPVQKAVADIFIFTPLRTVRNIYSLNVLLLRNGRRKKAD